MTGPVTTEALAEALTNCLNDTFRGVEFCGGRWSSGAGCKMAVDALLAGPLAPLLAAHQQQAASIGSLEGSVNGLETALQQVTAERDEARAKMRSACLDALAAQDQAAENDERARAAEASLATATSELAQLQAEGEAKDRALKLLLPFVDYAAGEGLMFRGSDDTDRPDMDAAELCIAAAAALGFELGDPDYCALVEQGEQEITALARAATAREG